MKLSTRGQYALHAMIFLAKHRMDGPQPLKTIAEDGLPEQYLEQLLGTLRRAGLVTTVRGAAGGYSLSGDPSRITVAHIIEATEGPVSLADCAEDEGHCGKGSDCQTRRTWRYLTESINSLMQGITLSDILENKPYAKGVHA